MRAIYVVAVCLLVSSAVAAEQGEKSALQGARAKPAVVAKASVSHATQQAKTEVPARVWSLEMACCEPQ
jgi:hypothetical protein